MYTTIRGAFGIPQSSYTSIREVVRPADLMSSSQSTPIYVSYIDPERRGDTPAYVRYILLDFLIVTPTYVRYIRRKREE